MFWQRASLWRPRLFSPERKSSQQEVDYIQLQAVHQIFSLFPAKASYEAINPELRRCLKAHLAVYWANYLPMIAPAYSAKGGVVFWQQALFCLFLCAFVSIMIVDYAVGSLVCILVLAVWVTLVSVLRLTKTLAFLTAPQPAVASENHVEIWPKVTLLAALHDEATVARSFVAAMQALDYPRDRLQLIILLEADDMKTIQAFQSLQCPEWVDIIRVPVARPRTKPKALNYALPMVRGEIIGLFDAEDRPHPEQIKQAVRRLMMAPQNVVAVQAHLSFYNAHRNMMTRFMAADYAQWFDVLLPGVNRLDLPMPLGGTSAYFRTAALVQIGGWDAYNVTEDADLGMRIYRQGWRCAMFEAQTDEEAVSSVEAWIRQRSRWIKGYMQTWLVHMRQPADLYKEIGLFRVVILNLLLMGSTVSFLAQPFYLFCFAHVLVVGSWPWQGYLSSAQEHGVFVIFVAGQVIALVPAIYGGWRRYGWPVGLQAVLMPVYWLLGGLAAFKALYEIVVAPQFWDKTTHGTASA